MKSVLEKLERRVKTQAGFTLIEILIVVILMGILATIIIPQISVSTEDAKLNTLKTSLSNMRSAIELYYFQHENQYPGARDISGVSTSVNATAETAFLQQITRYTDTDGDVSDTKDSTHTLGPYVKGGALPTNPYNDLSSVVCDASETDITVKASSGTGGWKFYTQTGVLLANDGDHDSL